MIKAARADRAERADALSTVRWVVAIALAVACGALIVEFATGVPGPAIPPGPIILGVAAVVVAAVRWRWIPALGLVVGVFLTGGAIGSGTTVPRLGGLSPVGPFIGTWVQTLAQLVAIVAGIVAVVVAARTPSSTRARAAG